MKLLLDSWRKRVIFLIGITGLFVVLGIGVFFLLPAQEGSSAEIMVSSEVMSINGLAFVQTIDPRRGIEFQNVLQLLTSRAAAEAASNDRYPPEQIIDRTSLKVTPNSGVVTLTVTAESTEDATAILTEILAGAVRLDREKQTQRVERLIEAVSGRSSQAEEGLKAINTRIARYLAEQKVTFSIDQERQRSASELLAQYDRSALQILMDNSRLASVLEDRDAPLWQAFNADYVPGGGNRVGEDPVEEARRQLDQAQAEVARLESRYGENHAEVKGANAGLEKAQETFLDRMEEKSRRLRLGVKANESALGELTSRSDQTEKDFQSSDVTTKPEYMAMVTERENAELFCRELSRRLIELQIYRTAAQGSFEVISPPFPSRSRSIKAFLAVISLSALFGGALGLVILYAITRRQDSSDHAIV